MSTSHQQCAEAGEHVCQQSSGRTCVEQGCEKAAGTWWGPLWCPEHDKERLDRVSAGFDQLGAQHNDYERPILPEGYAWGHQATSHGGRYVWPGRAVLVMPSGPWTYPPETCPQEESFDSRTEWLLGGRVLVCTDCGLDCT